MDQELKNALDHFIKDFTETEEFSRMLKLRDLMEHEYVNELNEFNSLKDQYENALKYKDYYPEFDKLEQRLSVSKEKLYSIPLVKEYLSLERENQNRLTEASNEIGSYISNKFKEKKVIR